jgi:hypothetical protein
MTHRERILAAIRGDVPDRLPWLPRLEFWYRAKLRDGTLPPEFRGLTLMEITDRLGIAYYAILGVPAGLPAEREIVDSALGIRRLASLPYEIEFDGIERRVTHLSRETVVEYPTPAGTLRTAYAFTDEMLAAGASKPWTTRHAIGEPDDIDAAAWVFSHLRVTPRLEGYLALRERVGDRGIVVASASGFACPMQLIMKDLMPFERFFYALQDYPDKIHRLADALEPYFDAMKAAAAASPAEVVLLGGNYDDSVTHPRFFRQYILPALRGYAETLHRKGKYLLTHTDGENRRLLPLYLEAGIDVADSICPWPMTRCSFDEIHRAFAGRITIVGGIPAVLLCPAIATFEDFRRYVDDIIGRYARHSHLVLGVSDMVTADCEWSRVQYISDRLTERPAG